MKENLYKPNKVEAFWQKKWEDAKIYSPDIRAARKPFDKSEDHRPFYNLMMFPYPSAEGMHVGNMYAFTGADIFGRFMRMNGFDVFEPIGLDGFGIHSENYAIKVGRHPKEQARISEKNFYRQLRATGNGFDWTRKLETYDPSYYKWTQWLFIQLFKKGLAYRKKAAVNFCPSCKTVLADEQVIEARPPATSPLKSNDQAGVASEVGRGKCERCGSVVGKKDLEQWFFKITKYADRLLYNLNKIDWVEKVKIAQRQWIGRSEGTRIRFKIDDLRFKNQYVEVFTTRADTLYGATFLVLAPEHPVVASLLNSKVKEIKDYVQATKKRTDRERGDEEKEKTGVFSGLHAINPLNKERLPVWIADYALMGYGTGALFGDAHDERDVKFAKKYKIPLKVTVITGNKEKDEKIKNFEECFTGYGVLIDSGKFSGLISQDAKKQITSWLKDHKSGGPEITYHLRDWLISRQRYWGPPIPMIYCKKCEWQPVPEKDLPVLLPDLKDWKPKGTGKSPLATLESFVNTKCPNCGLPSKRETDVSDTFLDSAWYFFRYLSTDIDSTAFDIERAKKWLPVKMYIGGAEHSVLHLLYSRFITMVLKDLGLIEFEEPFSRFYAHGLIIKDGAKMSKSRGNVIVPDEYVRKYGADTLRCYLMFLGPFSDGGDFRDSGMEGMFRFVKRVWVLVSSIKYQVLSIDGKENIDLDKIMHKTIKKVTEDMVKLHYNTAIAYIMEYYNSLNSYYTKYKILNTKYCKTLVLLLAPFAPHMTEELWQQFFRNSKFQSIHLQPWPKYDSKYLEEDEVIIAVQINGKVRDTIGVQSEKLKVRSVVEQLARQSDKIKKYLEGKIIRRIIYVEGKVINFVIT